MNIHVISVDMDMDMYVKFHISGNPAYLASKNATKTSFKNPMAMPLNPYLRGATSPLRPIPDPTHVPTLKTSFTVDPVEVGTCVVTF